MGQLVKSEGVSGLGLGRLAESAATFLQTLNSSNLTGLGTSQNPTMAEFVDDERFERAPLLARFCVPLVVWLIDTPVCLGRICISVDESSSFSSRTRLLCILFSKGINSISFGSVRA
jgi:hypothetical protein